MLFEGLMRDLILASSKDSMSAKDQSMRVSAMAFALQNAAQNGGSAGITEDAALIEDYLRSGKAK